MNAQTLLQALETVQKAASQLEKSELSRNISSFVKKHRGKLLVAAAVGSAAALLVGVLSDGSSKQTSEQRESEEDEEHRAGENTLEDEKHVLLSGFLQKLKSNLTEIFDVKAKQKEVTAKLDARSSKWEKKQAMKDLAVTSFSRTIVAVYLLCFGEEFIHMQLEQLSSMTEEGIPRLAPDAHDHYLSLLLHLLEDPLWLKELCSDIETGVRNTLNTFTTEEPSSFGIVQLEKLISNLRCTVDGGRGGRTAAVRGMTGLLERADAIVCTSSDDCEHDLSCWVSVHAENQRASALLTRTRDTFLHPSFAQGLSHTLTHALHLLTSHLAVQSNLPPPNPLLASLSPSSCPDSPFENMATALSLISPPPKLLASTQKASPSPGTTKFWSPPTPSGGPAPQPVDGSPSGAVGNVSPPLDDDCDKENARYFVKEISRYGVSVQVGADSYKTYLIKPFQVHSPEQDVEGKVANVCDGAVRRARMGPKKVVCAASSDGGSKLAAVSINKLAPMFSNLFLKVISAAEIHGTFGCLIRPGASSCSWNLRDSSSNWNTPQEARNAYAEASGFFGLV